MSNANHICQSNFNVKNSVVSCLTLIFDLCNDCYLKMIKIEQVQNCFKGLQDLTGKFARFHLVFFQQNNMILWLCCQGKMQFRNSVQQCSHLALLHSSDPSRLETDKLIFVFLCSQCRDVSSKLAMA